MTVYIADQAFLTPHKPAVIAAGSGEVLTFEGLDQESNRVARLLWNRGLRRGDHVAILMENNLRFHPVVWAALRSGLYITPINRYLPPTESAYIINDCGARAIVSSFHRREVLEGLLPHIPDCPIRLMVGGTFDGWESYEAAIGELPPEPLEPQWMGDAMLYSSGTTGRPKGILRPLPKLTVDVGCKALQAANRYRYSEDTIYLSPAPLYHSAPLGSTVTVLSLGGTVVMMERFDAEEALRCIARYRVTHSQWVPTMFVRMLKLPLETREAHDLSSHRFAIHAAAPCPVEVKRRMIEWWGPILYEYYAGSEATGATAIDSAEWLARPGSVGKATLGTLHICDESGRELAPGETGLIYFERENRAFGYHNDPEKTRNAQHPDHPDWTTMGDLGHVDAEGYLYLTDRKAFTIVSGGVNIYPQAIEDALTLHPKVGDIAVFGVPDEDLGEAVKAVVEPAEGVPPTPELAAELLEFARGTLARYMVPRSIDFIAAMPRLPTGKLYKRALRDRYWPDTATQSSEATSVEEVSS